MIGDIFQPYICKKKKIMKKIVYSFSILILLFSCRQEEILSNDDLTNLRVIQSKRNLRSSLNVNYKNNIGQVDSSSVKTLETNISFDTEPTKIPPKR